MRFRGSGLAAFALALGLTSASVFAQSADTDRKLKFKTQPAYPELAKKMNVSGKVKIEVVVAPDGHVKSSRVIGGHPLLVQACQDAVKEWKYTPAPDETIQQVEFDFRPNG